MKGTNHISAASFIKNIKGKNIRLVTLKNRNGLRADITNYGARWVSLFIKDKAGEEQNIVAGFDSIDGYLQSTEPFYGCIAGRVANRIKEGKFSLKGKDYQLPVNNPPNHLHGGNNGFHSKVWEMDETDLNQVTLTYFSENGDEGYPGNLTVKVVYTLTDDICMDIKYEASTDVTTLINLTNHAFFNLNGMGNGSIENHSLHINADSYHPINTNFIPLGKEAFVTGTAFDFRQPKNIGEHINDNDEQLNNGKGYDHNFVLKKPYGVMDYAATVRADISGIEMDVFTTEPGMQFYSGNFMKSENIFRKGIKDEFRTAFCLETQHYPDAINQPGFPSIVLEPGQIYKSNTRYRVAVK